MQSPPVATLHPEHGVQALRNPVQPPFVRRLTSHHHRPLCFELVSHVGLVLLMVRLGAVPRCLRRAELQHHVPAYHSLLQAGGCKPKASLNLEVYLVCLVCLQHLDSHPQLLE